MRPRIDRVLHEIGAVPMIGPLLHELRFRALAAGAKPASDHDLPPVRLRYSVAGTPDAAWYRESGRLAATLVRERATCQAGSWEACSPALDFGCGSGRVLTHLTWTGVELHGCDRNAAAIAWCRDHVDAEVAVNELAPPLHYPDGMFGLVWSISVFTHLPKPLQEPWALELRRVLRPDGVLLVTTHGPSLRGKLTRRERERFERGELVVRAPRAAGSYCNTFHPPDYLEKLFAVAGLRLFSYEDRVMHGQALAVFRPN